MRAKPWVVLGLVVVSFGCGDDGGGNGGGELRLTLLHANDAQSEVVSAGSGALADFGGAARFATLVDRLRDEADGAGRAVVTLSAGDNFLAGAELNASLQDGVFYDAFAARAIDYDAIVLGNHDFDFGPDLLADFIGSFSRPVPHLAVNLDFTAEPALERLREDGDIAGSVVLSRQGVRIGIVGVVTPDVGAISSPRGVTASADTAAAVQAEIDRLTADGAGIVILLSHLRGLEEEAELVGALHGVDIAVVGGGRDLLANSGDPLLPGDETDVAGPYPLLAEDGSGREVPIVSTAGRYGYVGRLDVDFDVSGEIATIGEESGPVRVAGGSAPDAVEPDAEVRSEAVEPVRQSIDALASRVVGTSEVALDGRSEAVRGMETNLGDLVADALLSEGRRLAAEFGAPAPVVALQNGGGILSNAVLPAGELTELQTFNALPFASFLAVVHEVSPAELELLLENAVSQVEQGTGRFAQVAGLKLAYDPTAQAQVLDDDRNVVTAGARVRDVMLEDGTPIVANGVPVAGAPTIAVATIDFLARGGDQYPFGDSDVTLLGLSYQQALRNYVVDGLDGQVPASLYPEGGSGRIRTVGGS